MAAEVAAEPVWPEALSLQFISRARPGRGNANAHWIKHPPLVAGFNLPLVAGFLDFEYLYPFYFGRSGDPVFVMRFEDPRDGSELRFAPSPFEPVSALFLAGVRRVYKSSP